MATIMPRPVGGRERRMRRRRGAWRFPLAGLVRLNEARQQVVEAGEAYRRAFRVLDADALPRADACDGAEHRDAVVAARVDDAAARPRRNAADRVAVGLRLDVNAEPAQRLRHGLDAVG